MESGKSKGPTDFQECAKGKAAHGKEMCCRVIHVKPFLGWQGCSSSVPVPYRSHSWHQSLLTAAALWPSGSVTVTCRKGFLCSTSGPPLSLSPHSPGEAGRLQIIPLFPASVPQVGFVHPCSFRDHAGAVTWLCPSHLCCPHPTGAVGDTPRGAVCHRNFV